MAISSDVFVAQGGSAEYDFLAIAGNKPTWTPNYGFLTYTWGSDPRFKIGGAFHGWFHGVVGSGGYAWDDGKKVGPEANAYSQFAGVLGTGVYVTGVAGTSIENVGVYGQNGEDPDSLIQQDYSAVGVFGVSNHGAGVLGWSTLVDGAGGGGVEGYAYSNNGVVGVANFGSGVLGDSEMQPGVYGVSGNDSGVKGNTGPEGPAPGPGLPTAAGVLGTSEPLPGVIGTSKMSAGVLGFSNNIGVYGVSTNPASYAGFFRGNVMVTNTLTATAKHAIVPFPDGTQRLLHCMESPEHWFEDFGAAKLKRGRAVVKLDADFAKVIKRGDYRVFVTPETTAAGSTCATKAPRASKCASSQAASRASCFPTRSSDGARTSRDTGASRR